MRLIDADALKEMWTKNWDYENCIYDGTFIVDCIDSMPTIATVEPTEWILPTIEPNRILPERMERGDIYEVGETIVVMNHDDYYDLLCKSWVPKRGESDVSMPKVR